VSGWHEHRSLPLTPDEIERQSFGIEQRGYDRDQVRSFLYEVAAALRLSLQGTQSALFGTRPPWPQGGEPVDAATAGAEAARILRAAHVSATIRQEEADAVAEAIVEQARQEADELLRRAEADAEHQRDRARRVLVAAQEEADTLVAQAEKRARLVLSGARQDALNHVQQVSRNLEARADQLIEAERTTLARLNEARRDLSALIETLAGAEPVLGPTVEILRLAVDARTHGGPTATVPPGAARPPGSDPADDPDHPVARMVRAAVARAVEAAAAGAEGVGAGTEADDDGGGEGGDPMAEAEAGPGPGDAPADVPITTILSEITDIITGITDEPGEPGEPGDEPPPAPNPG
jgi:DivIVA domain-containing protein